MIHNEPSSTLGNRNCAGSQYTALQHSSLPVIVCLILLKLKHIKHQTGHGHIGTHEHPIWDPKSKDAILTPCQ